MVFKQNWKAENILVVAGRLVLYIVTRGEQRHHKLEVDSCEQAPRFSFSVFCETVLNFSVEQQWRNFLITTIVILHRTFFSKPFQENQAMFVVMLPRPTDKKFENRQNF